MIDISLCFTLNYVLDLSNACAIYISTYVMFFLFIRASSVQDFTAVFAVVTLFVTSDVDNVVTSAIAAFLDQAVISSSTSEIGSQTVYQDRATLTIQENITGKFKYLISSAI